MGKGDIVGKWAWVLEDGSYSKSSIEFISSGDSYSLRVFGQDDYELFSLNPLCLNASEDGEEKSVTFCNYWKGKKTGKYFQFESKFSQPEEKGIFVNVQEYELIDENTLKTKLFGYRFDCEEENWLPFQSENILKRVS